jgi:quinol monooxygenase YgiN
VAGAVHMPWYATGFRADGLEEALKEIAPVSLRYGARSFQVFRYRDDRYKFLMTVEFEDKLDFERYWAGPEFTRWRTIHNSWYQVPMTYGWADVSAAGSMPAAAVAGGAPDTAAGTGTVGDVF